MHPRQLSTALENIEKNVTVLPPFSDYPLWSSWNDTLSEDPLPGSRAFGCPYLSEHLVDAPHSPSSAIRKNGFFLLVLAAKGASAPATDPLSLNAISK